MIRDEIENMIKNAMLNHETVKTTVYRDIKTAILAWKTAKENVGKTYDDVVEISILRKLTAQYKDTAETCNDGKHDELVNNAKASAEIVESLLPAPVTEEQIENTLKTLDIPHTKQYMGQLIKEIKRILPAADGKMVSQVVMKNLL